MMEKKNYLNHITLKVFLYLLYCRDRIVISALQTAEKENFVKDICKNKLEEYFILEKNGKVFKDIDYKNFMGKDFTDISLLNEPLKINLIKENKDNLLNFIGKYINNFKDYPHIFLGENYYSFDKSINEVLELLGASYNNYGKNFNIDIPLNDKSEYSFYSKELRFIDILFYFLIKNYAEINSCKLIEPLYHLEEDIQFIPESLININIKLNKSPGEIADIEKFWLVYGDIRINEPYHIAYYKNNRYPFKSENIKSFKLLCYLVKNHGKDITIKDAYNVVEPDDKSLSIYKESERFKIIKDKITDYSKYIKKNLKITEDNNPTIDIHIYGNNLILISNPPSR